MNSKGFMRGLTTVIVLLCVIVSGCNRNTSDTISDQPTATPSPFPTPTPKANQQLLDIVAAAKLGKIPGTDYTVLNSTFAQVKQAWGQPDQTDPIGAGKTYAKYTSRHIEFGYGADGSIFDLRSYDPLLSKLDYQSIVQELGQPQATIANGDDQIYVYATGQDLQLKFVIPKSSGKVDHISVYNPSLANKAQVSPAPSNNYYLDIKGVSNQLTNKAWLSMQAMRKDIVDFSKLHKGKVFINGPNKKRVALTFDDGPDDKVTPAIIETLKKYRVKGSFFFVGNNVKKYPEVVKKAYENGNLVLNHSFKHDDLTTLSESQIENDLRATDEAIQAIIGKKPAIIRTPFGATDEKTVRASDRSGHVIVIWSIDTLDWSQKESKNIQNNVLSNIRNGDIILMHSTSTETETAKALPIIIEELIKRGFEIVDVAELLGVKAYQ